MQLERSAGFSLIGMALFLTVLGVVISTALILLLPDLERVGRMVTVANLRADKNALLGFAARQRRLPDVSEFATLVPNSLDGYRNPIQYAYDGRLTGRDALCGFSDTLMAVADQGNVAFVIWSSGRNGRVNRLSSGEPDKRSGVVEGVVRFPNPPFSNQNTPDDSSDDWDDLLEWVTLDVLQQRAGCPDGERLGIAVDGVPVGFEGERFGSVTLTALGGSGTGYQWCVESSAMVLGGALHHDLVVVAPGDVPVVAVGMCTSGLASRDSSVLTLAGDSELDRDDGMPAGKRYDVRLFLKDSVGNQAVRLLQWIVKKSVTDHGDPEVKLSGSGRLSRPGE
ncbi:MAG: hypothetical protein G8237_08740 [Magnetococcales bacterium]|nr:hypothetical protein [Magnetococcales bacterium]